MRGQGRSLDGDSYLWGAQEPDYVGELAREVARVVGDGRYGKGLCERVAARLLDRARVRVATPEESAMAAQSCLMVWTRYHFRKKGALAQRLLANVDELVQNGAVMSREQLRGLAGGVAERIAVAGCWDGKLSDDVQPEMQPLHMPAVREALGALIPADLHATLDKAAARVKDAFGPVGGGSVLFMDSWRVSVRAEDALARSQLQEDALEFFLLVLRRLCNVMELPVAIASKTVGREVGRQESATRLASVMQKWRTVWNGEDVRKKEELLLMVAVDERSLPQDWMCVSVRSVTKGQRLGEATRFVVRIHDAAQRPSVARRVAKNLDVLLRGVAAVSDAAVPEIEFLTVPACPVASQRSLCAFGLLLGHVALQARMPALDMLSPSFLPDVSHVLRAAFSEFRADAGARGVRDVHVLLTEKSACRAVLQKLGVAPALVPVRETHAASSRSSPTAVGPLQENERRPRMLRVATWNIAGGKKSDDAPSAYSLTDQQASVMREVLRWERSYGCDVLALQE